jgi:hypothetical protein
MLGPVQPKAGKSLIDKILEVLYFDPLVLTFSRWEKELFA